MVGPLTSLAVGGGRGRAAGSSPPTGCSLLAVEGLAGANLLVGVLNLVPGLPLDGGRVLKAAVWGCTGNAAPRHHRRRLGRPGHRGRGAGWPLLQAPILGDEPTILDFDPVLFVISRVPVDRRHAARCRRPGCAAGSPSWWPATWPAAPSPSPTTSRSAEAVRRAQEAAGRRHRHRDQPPAARSASSTRRRCWPRPRTGARGSRSRRWPGPSRTGCGCRPRSPART